MDNEIMIDFIDSMKPLFKEITGLDIDNHTEEEWENWYYNSRKKEAEDDKYIEEIMNTAERIIEHRSYSTLYSILVNYDHYVKLASNRENDYLPFWCYCYFDGNE